MDEIKAQELYDFFNKEGYDLGDFNNFTSALEDELKRKELYDFFNKEGYDVGSLENFNLKKKDPSQVSTSPSEVGESVSGGTESLDQSIQDRLNKGSQLDLSVFTTSSDQEAMKSSLEEERSRVYDAFGLNYSERQVLLDRKSQIELEKEQARKDLTNAKMARLGIKQKEGSDRYYIPTDKGLFSGNFLQSLDQAFTGYDYDDESEFRLGSKEEAEEYAIKNYKKSDSVIDTEIEDLERKTKPLSNLDESDVYKALEEQEEDAIKAEEYVNTNLMNSFIDQGFRGERLNQLVEQSGINTAYVKSKAFMVNGQETSPANLEQQVYDRDFITGLQNGSIKVSIDPAVAETEYGKFLKATLDVQSNAGSEIGDIAQEFLAGGASMGSGFLEVGEVLEAPFADEYMKTGGFVANHVKDYAEQLRNMQRMYKYPGVMEAIRAGAWDDVPALFGKSIAGSSMQIVIMAMARRLGVNPKITLGGLGVSAFGQKSLELKELRESGKIDISNFNLALNSIASGGFEVLYEIPTYQMIGAVQKTLRNAGKKAAKQVAKEVSENAFKDIFIKEPGSEMLTEISTMLVDHVTLTEKTDDAGILAKSFDDVVNRVANAGIAGFGMAAGIRTVGGAGAVGVSALNSIKGTDLTNKIVATYQVVNEDGSLGETKELTGAEYKEWSKDPNNIAGELNGDIKVNRYNSDIADAIDDIANTNSEDVVQANNDVNEAGSEANSLLNQIENDLQESPEKAPSDKIAKVKGLLNRMSEVIKETGAKGAQDLKGLTAKLNNIINKAGLSLNDNVLNQNTDNANIQGTETITEIQTEAQARAIEKGLKDGSNPSIVLSQDGIGVSKDGKSVSENNITLGKFKSKAAAKRALNAFKKQNSKAAVEERRHAEIQKKNNKAFNKVDKNNLDEISQDDLSNDYNIISASVDGLGEASNQQRNDKLEKVLKKKGLKYKKVQVVENGISKTAFMVEGMESSAALDLAVGFGQKTITSSKDGILHRDGTVESLDGNVYTGPNARNGAKIVVMNVNGRKVSVRLGTNKASYSKDFNAKNIEDINPFIENLPDNQKKILGHVLRFFSNIKGLNIRVVKTDSAMKKQLESEGYSPERINSIASNRAFYRAKDGTMVLNLQKMNLNTPFHEITHPLVDFIKRENPDLYSRIEQMVEKSESNIPGSPFKKRWYKNGRRQSGTYMSWAESNYPGKSRSAQIEEAFAEMIGDAAANQFMKDNSKLKQIKDFIAEILEYFNINAEFLKEKNLSDLKLDDVKDIGQLRGNLGAALAKGKTVSVGGVDFNVSKPKNSKEVDSSIREQVDSQQHGDDLGVTEVTNMEGVETQEIRFQPGDYTPNFDLSKVKRGSIKEFNDQKAMLMCIDRSVSGTVESPSGVVKEFNGGMYYSYQDGTGVWAFSSKSAASKVLNKAKESGGLVLLVAMSPQSIDGSVEMFDYVMDEVDNSIKKKRVKKKIVLDFINKKLNLKKVQDKLNKEGISKKKVKSINEFRELIMSLDGAFEVRKDLVSKMIKGKDLSSWGIPTREEMYSIVNQSDIKDLTGNPVVAAIRIDTESEFVDSRENSNIKDHPTYPYVVKGEPLMVFNEAVDASELWGDLNLADKYLINPETGQPYSEATTTSRRNAAIMMATPIVNIRAQADDSFTGGRNQYGRFNVTPSEDRITATPQDLSLENVSGLSSKGNWSIITGTVEADGSYDADVNVSNNARLYKELVEEFGAENIVVTDGVYLNKDQGPSYFISGITENRAMQIGKNFDQEGVLTRRGNIFTDGSGMNPASEKVYVGKEALAQDGNSTTPDGVTFSLDINWKSKVPLSTGIRSQVASGETNTITEDQLTLLKSTYSEIESKYPDIQVEDGMIKMYHYSDMELDVVDPRSAVMNSYSRQEYKTWGRSRVFFYTDPNIKEGIVGGHYKNTTVFPIDRLYPLTEDPLGLNDLASRAIEIKRNSGDKTQATIKLNATTIDSASMAISKLQSLLKDMGVLDSVDFGAVTENFRYNKNEDGTFEKAGIESISFSLNYPLGSENINSLIRDTFDSPFFEKISPKTQPINTFEEVARVAESLGFQGFIYDHVGGKTVTAWQPVEIVGDRFQVNDQDQSDVYVSGLGAIMWDLTKPIIDADYELGEWATRIKDKDRPYPIRATQLFGMPKGLHSNAEIKEMVILSRGKLDEQMLIANKNQKNLKKVVNQEIKRIKDTLEYKQATAQEQEAMLSNLTPEGLNDLVGDINKIMELPEQSKVRQALLQVRDHIDTLSTYLYENGLVSGPMRYTIEGNLGFYLTRAYKKYESSSWRQTDQEVIRRAELFIADKLMSDKNMSKEDAMIRARQMVDNLIKDKISITSFKRNTGIGGSMTRVNDIFKERNEDLPKEIRDLLGEINEPFENYVNTISKLSRTVVSHQLYEDLIAMGMGKFIADPNLDDDKTSQIPGISNKLEGSKWGPLEGKFVDNEMFAMLNAYEDNSVYDSLGYKAYMTFVYATKKFATVHNPGTHAVNLIGNTYFSLANGHVNPIKFFDAARTAIGEITNLSGKEREAFYQELISLGVVSSSASLAEIVQIGQDIAGGKDVTAFLDRMNQGRVRKVATIPLKGLRDIDKGLTAFYQAQDDMFKIFGFITEKARYMEAGMSETEAKAMAARNTRNLYPNYDMVPNLVRVLGRNPFVATFVAFQSEAIRCTKNALQLAFQEMGNQNPKVKLMGAKRLAFSLSALTFMENIASTAMSMLFGSGSDDEDDDIETYGLRHLTAPWDKDSKLTPIEKGYITPDHEAYNGENNGNAYVQYMNVSRLSGGGLVKDMLRIAFTDMNTPEQQSSLMRIAFTLGRTFLSQDMALEVVEEIRQNKGNKIYNPTDNFASKITDIALHLGKNLGPGGLRRVKIINDSLKENSDKITNHELLAMIGLRITTIDVNKALFFRSRDLYSSMRSRSEGQGYDLRDSGVKLTRAIDPGSESFDSDMAIYFNNLVDVVATARRYGVPLSEGDNNCRDILRKSGVPSNVIDKVMYNVYNGKNKDSLLIMYK